MDNWLGVSLGTFFERSSTPERNADTKKNFPNSAERKIKAPHARDFCFFFFERKRIRLYSLKSPSVVFGNAILEDNFGSGNAADGPVPAIPHSPVDVSEVEALEIVIERWVAFPVALLGHFGREEELIEVAQYHQQVEAQVGEAGHKQRHFLVRLLGARGIMLFPLASKLMSNLTICQHLKQPQRAQLDQIPGIYGGKCGVRT